MAKISEYSVDMNNLFSWNQTDDNCLLLKLNCEFISSCF